MRPVACLPCLYVFLPCREADHPDSASRVEADASQQNSPLASSSVEVAPQRLSSPFAAACQQQEHADLSGLVEDLSVHDDSGSRRKLGIVDATAAATLATNSRQPSQVPRVRSPDTANSIFIVTQE
jgi:hypothetical protein